MRRAQKLASDSGTTTKSVVEQALSRYIAEWEKTERYRLPDLSVAGSGLQPEFDQASWAELRDAAYGEHG